MIGLDTNVLVRHLVQDDTAQGRRATEAIVTFCTPDEPGFISLLVLAELCWVLRGTYRYNRAAIAAVIGALLRTAEFRVEDDRLVAAALSLYRTSTADFADCLIGLISEQTGCDAILTFDTAAASLPGFRAL